MNFFLAADKGREKRDGSALGDRLNYWDVKMSIQYDFMLKVERKTPEEKNLRVLAVNYCCGIAGTAGTFNVGIANIPTKSSSGIFCRLTLSDR